MIVLDTKVLSELMKATPADSVMCWVALQPATSLYTTSITQAEICMGSCCSLQANDATHSRPLLKQCSTRTLPDAFFPLAATLRLPIHVSPPLGAVPDT